MPKYSVDSGDDDSSDGSATACEMCGADDVDLHKADIAGATLQVCASCAPDMEEQQSSSDQSSGSSDSSDEQSVSKPSETNGEPSNPGYTISRTDSSHWEQEGTNYEKDPTPYLVEGYAKTVTEARQEEGMTKQDFADKADITVAALDAVEAGAATSNDVGGSVIRAIEATLGVSLVDE